MQCAAHELKKIKEENFDIIILNSVIYCFPGYHYLKNVIDNLIKLMKKDGIIFLGDVMDLEKREDLESYIYKISNDLKKQNPRIKTDWSKELFISRGFINDMAAECSEI